MRSKRSKEIIWFGIDVEYLWQFYSSWKGTDREGVFWGGESEGQRMVAWFMKGQKAGEGKKILSEIPKLKEG